jgi:hypothetical protein
MEDDDMIEGLRVKIVEDIEIFPIGIFPVGLTGVVTDVAKIIDDDPQPSVLCLVKLDRHFDILNGWDNSLQVLYTGEECGVCTPENFEPIRGFE